MRYTVLEKLLRRMGVGNQYVGFLYTIEAVKLYNEADDIVKTRLTKDIYPVIAKKFRTKHIGSVERNIRYVAELSWKKNRELLEQVAGYPLKSRPKTSEFIDMLSYYLTENSESK